MTSSKLLATSLIVSLLTLTTSLINYLTMAALAFFFGTNEEVDAFFAASTLPQIFLAVVSTSLTNAFLPFFIEKKHENENFAWALASKFFIFLISILFFISLITSLLAQPLIHFMNPGFSESTVHLAASFLPPLFLSFFFSGSSVLLISLHFAHHRFFLPSISQLLNSLLTILFLFFLRSSLGIKSLVLGTLIGSICQFIILWPIFLKKRQISLKAKIALTELNPLLRLLLPLLVASFIYRSNPFIERYFASQLGEGSIALLGYAGKIITALVILLSQGISTVTFPRLAEQATAGDEAKLNQTLNQTYRLLLFMLIPVTFFLLIYRHEIVALLFERGQFSPMATTAVAGAILAYGGYFFFGSLANPVVNVFYSYKKTALTSVVGLSGFGLFVFLANFLSKKYNIIGVAAASSIQCLFTFSVFIYLLKKMIAPLSLKEIGRNFSLMALCSFISWGVIILMEKLNGIPLAYPFSILPKFVMFCLFYLLLIRCFKSEDMRLFFKKIKKN